MAWAIGVHSLNSDGATSEEPTSWISLFNQRSVMKSYALGWRASGQAQRRADLSCPLLMGEVLKVYFDEDIPVTDDDDMDLEPADANGG